MNLDELEAQPFEPPDVYRVSLVYRIEQQVCLLVKPVDPPTGIAEEPSPVLGQVIGRQKPDHSLSLVDHPDAKQGNRLVLLAGAYGPALVGMRVSRHQSRHRIQTGGGINLRCILWTNVLGYRSDIRNNASSCVDQVEYLEARSL